MKMRFATCCIAIATALGPSIGDAADRASEHKPPVISAKDSELTARIKARLAEEKFSSLPNISIDSDARGAVFLRGKVRTEQEADNIVSTVHRMKGVTAVRSLFSITDEK